MNLRNVKLSSVAFVAAITFAASTSMAADQSQSALKKQAKVTGEQATKSALSQVPGGTVKSFELEKENGVRKGEREIDLVFRHRKAQDPKHH